ncbi:hypothetical protein JXM67_09835 [candidate division WOR-3 bacterium]|nr:hypothetical protein [candidate division WOR-3 bacterium]
MKAYLDWLLEGPAFVRYSTLLDLMDKPADDKEVKSTYKEMVADPLVQDLITEVSDWENQYTITRHNDAAHPLHKFVFLADIGVRKEAMKPALDSILSHQSPEGPFQIKIVIPKAFGGDDVPRWDWVATDAPLLLYALLRLGVRSKKVMKGVEHIRSRIADPGYPCFASATMGNFKGPGKKSDPCPYANLIILRMMSQVPELTDSTEAVRAAEMLLGHWELRGKRKFFLFGIGRDFAKPKVPRIWYDIIHYTDTLTRLPFTREDRRLKEVVTMLRDQADSDGRFACKSIWTKWKGWEFCQKKEPSRWVTFLAHRIFKRMGI